MQDLRGGDIDMTKEEVLEGFENLAKSQGRYGRLLAELRELERDKPEEYEKFFEQFKDCEDMVDAVFVLEFGL